MSEHESEGSLKTRTALVDPSGNTLKGRITWRERWSSISARTKVFVISVVAIAAGAASLLGNLESIHEHFRSKPQLPYVPLITVKLSNGQTNVVRVAARGDFLLWLPGPEARYTTGKYELVSKDGIPPKSGQVTIDPRTTATVYARILNQPLFGRLLEQADCDITFGIRRVDAGLKFTDELPFTKEALAKYYVPADVGVTETKGVAHNTAPPADG